jgi:DNA-binding winged helix-turn-helix (wHTH) protein
MSELHQSPLNAHGFNVMNTEELSYEFGPFRLEPATRRLLREGEPLPLTPKAFDTLLLLVQNRERVMDKEEVLRRIWPDAVVEESNLAQNVFTLRRTLGDTPEGARFIATMPRRGYRFVAPSLLSAAPSPNVPRPGIRSRRQTTTVRARA